jgi:hypothetical protein
MRAYEILREDYNAQLESDLNNILVSAKAAGISDIKPEAIVQQMQKMGYSIDVDSLITLLQGSEMIQNASPDNIHVGAETPTADSGVDTQSKVNGLAMSATSKGLK